MGVRESYSDEQLANNLLKVAQFCPDFISIIGYSFAYKKGTEHDDHISLECFLSTHRHFRGNIYVIDPHPDALQHTLGDRLKSNNVFSIPQRWNLLAHAFAKASLDEGDRRSLSYVCADLFDRFEGDVVFPRAHD
jgi:hypothetical protein